MRNWKHRARQAREVLAKRLKSLLTIIIVSGTTCFGEIATGENISPAKPPLSEAVHPILSALGALLAIILAFKLIFYGRERGNYLGAAISLCGFPFIFGFMHFVLHGIFGLAFP